MMMMMMVQLNRFILVVCFLISSVVINRNLAAPSTDQAPTSGFNDEPETVRTDGLIGSTWKLLRSTLTGDDVTDLDPTVKLHPERVDPDVIVDLIRQGGIDPQTGSDQVPEHYPDTDSDYYYRTDTDDETGASWSDGRSDDAFQYPGGDGGLQVRGVQRLPQAIIIGVKKGGTRALLEFLKTHPDVRAPGPEIHFFDKNYHKGLDWYRSQMPPTIPGQITVEKTPSYWITREVPGRVYNMSRDIRLIVVVRDPSTRALSDYTQAITKRPNIGPFEHLAFLDNTTGMVDTSWGAIRIGIYARHLERWLEHFPRRSIHFVNGERLIADPAAELDTVQDFLGLKRVITDKHFFFNATKGFPCLKKSEGSGSPRCLGKTKGRPHPAVDEKLLQRLREFYRPFNEKFYELTGINFNWA